MFFTKQLFAAVFVFGTTVLSSPTPPYPMVSAPKLDKRSFEVKDGIRYNVYQHHATGATIKFVKNSGICETTPGVNQYSGYLSVGTNQNMFFWSVLP
jgi:hypothetical protein